LISTFLVTSQKIRVGLGGGGVFLGIRITHVGMRLYASSLDFKQRKGSEGQFGAGDALLKASHYKLRT